VQDAKNQTTTYTYDSMDRLATRTDALGRQVGVVDGSGSYSSVKGRI
jgi:YD repeat-containing protein